VTAPMDEAPDYRPVSPLAVAAAVLGCCSAVALATPFAWFVPLVGVVAAVAALADLARPAAPRVGRLPALLGLALAVGFGAQAVSDAAVGRWIERTRAVATATAWLDAIHAGRPAEALGISSRSILPATGSPDAENETDQTDRFAALPAVKAVAGGRPTITSATPLGTDDRAWLVRATIDEGRVVRIIAVPRTAAKRRGGIERWTVTAVEVES